MFEYIKLRNFKSFGNLEFDLCDRHNKPKKMVLIYGENGIGKSNIASAFYMLAETTRTMHVRDMMEGFLTNDPEAFNNNDDFKRFLRARFKDTERLIKENKTVGSTDPLYMEFGFQIDGRRGRYLLEFNNNQLIHERLEYTLRKNRGCYFDIMPKKMTINAGIFKNKEAHSAISSACHKFWGKHSLLSIVYHEAQDKSDQFIADQFSDYFDEFLTFIDRLSCKIKFGSRQERGSIHVPQQLLAYFDEGTIDKEMEPVLNKTEKMLSAFFNVTYKDIKKVYYKRTYQDNSIHYELVFSKIIAGTVRDIDWSLESTGTQALIEQLPFLMVSILGSTSIVDEFDTGIHDILVQNLATSLYGNINGQLIMTTHNTSLMNADIPNECIYVINELTSGDKEVKCVLKKNNKLSENNNLQRQYLGGVYSGIPEKSSINFDCLLRSIE